MFNNCFVVGGINKQACYVKGGTVKPLNKKDNSLLPLWSRSFEDVAAEVRQYNRQPQMRGDEPQFATVSLYLENAMYGDLYIFCIDIDTKHETEFIGRVEAAADFFTISKNGGRHAYFGVRKDVGLFDSINLLTSSGAKGFITKTGILALDGTKFDVFCDAPHFIYELLYGNEQLSPLTDKTQVVFDLLKDIEIRRSVEYDRFKDAEGNDIVLEYLSEDMMTEQMNERQRLVFEDLKTISADCDQREWFSIGCDINAVFDWELGGSVWLWWSAKGETFQPQSCANTWGTICGKDNVLHNSKWAALVEVNAFDIPLPKKEKKEPTIAETQLIEEFTACFEDKEDDSPLTFRGLPIEWEMTERQICTVTKNAFGSDDREVETKDAMRIKYDGEFYTLREFMSKFFPEYRKYNKKVKFNTEDMSRIGHSQRRRAAYHYMEKRYELATVSEQDSKELMRLVSAAPNTKTQVEQAILGYNNGENGVERLVTFGVLPVQDNKVKTWCYVPEFYGNSIQYKAANRTWEDWQHGILQVISKEDLDDVYIAVSYQGGAYLTLPREKREKINDWIAAQRHELSFGDKAFPFSGPINDEDDYEFTIDFDKDCIESMIGEGNLLRTDAAQFNKAKGEAQSKRMIAEYGKLDNFPAGEWTMTQLKEFGYNQNNIDRYYNNGELGRKKKGRGYVYWKKTV